MLVKSTASRVRWTWVQIPALPPTSGVTLDNVLNFSVPHLSFGNNYCTSLMSLLEGLKEMTHTSLMYNKCSNKGVLELAVPWGRTQIVHGQMKTSKDRTCPNKKNFIVNEAGPENIGWSWRRNSYEKEERNCHQGLRQALEAGLAAPLKVVQGQSG